MRDRLIELIQQADAMCGSRKQCEGCVGFGKGEDCCDYNIADHLLANGVIVPPCKVGDTVYRISTRAHTKMRYIQETTISRIAIDKDGIWLFCACNPVARCVFGKTVFLTREEAEQALKGEHNAEIH